MCHPVSRKERERGGEGGGEEEGIIWSTEITRPDFKNIEP